MSTIKKKRIDKIEFLKLLSTLTIAEVLKVEFTIENVSNLETLVVCADEQKKMYLCKICKVFQYGEKNLISHLGGRKHCLKMDSVKQLFVTKDNEINIDTNKCQIVQNKMESNIAGVRNDNKFEKNINSMTQSLSTLKPQKTIQNKLCISEPPNISSKTTKIISQNVSLKDTSKKQLSKFTMFDQTVNSGSDTKNTVTLKHHEKIIDDESHDSLMSEHFKSKSSQNCGSIALVNKSNKNIIQAHGAGRKHNVIADINTSSVNQNLGNLNRTETSAVNGMKTLLPSNIVKNPLSVKKTTISCVPISKLICSKHTIEIKSDSDDTIALSMQPNESTAHKGGKNAEFNIEENEKRKFIPSSNCCDSIFRSNVPSILGRLGVEYVIKIMRHLESRDARFLCSLCNITTDDTSMHNHILSYNHRLTFCEKHFPTAMRQYRQYISHVPNDQVFKILPSILEKLAMAIEKYHGCETPYLCYENSFSKNRQNIVSTVFNRRHASELHGPAFTHVVDVKDVELIIENASKGKLHIIRNNAIKNEILINTFNSPNGIVSNQNTIASNYPNNLHVHEVNRRETVDDETHKRMVDMFLRDTRQPQPQPYRKSSRIYKRSRSRSSSSERKRKRSNRLTISQWNIERKSLSPLRRNDIWQAYRHLVDQSVRELNTKFDLYKSDPEEHPLYKDEWQIFWKQRKDELIAAGKNYRTYNYQSEWILFFKARLEDLYNEDVENIKIRCRERLCLPMTNENLSNSKYHVHLSYNRLKGDSLTKISDDNTINFNKCRDNINVIHVLRLLTALEDHLGSLGPSIIELLAKALQIYKINPDKANILFLSSTNCVILAAAKEKLKSLITSKYLNPAQERALKKAINDTENLLEFATTTGDVIKSSNTDIHDQEFGSRINSYNLYKKKQDSINTTHLASKLATSLISQGKTSINQKHLEHIVQAYSLIEKKRHQDMISSTGAINNILNSS